MPTARRQDENGYLTVRGCPIASFGIFDYSAGQLGLPGDPNRIVKVFRPESAVSDPGALESFKDVPLINDHAMLSGFQNDSDSVAPEEKGIDGVLNQHVYYDAPWMRGDIKFYSRSAQAALASGKKDLSLGYSCDFLHQSGEWNGQAYEVVQTNMRGNHIALVDVGRVPGARVLDGLIFDHLDIVVQIHQNGANDMVKKGVKRTPAMDNAVEQLKALLPALETFLNQEANEPEHQDTGATGGMGASSGEQDASKPNEGSESNGAAEGATATPEHTEAAASGAAEGAAAGAANGSDPAANGEGGESGSEAEVTALVSQAKELLAKLEAALNGDQVGGENNGGELATDSTEGITGLQEVNKGEGGAVCADEGQGAGAGAIEGNGKTSPGPAAGVHAEAGDSAIQRFYADLAAKTSLYDRLSPIVGAFDHKAMDARSVAVYGARKLNIKCADSAAVAVVGAYLDGRAAKKEANKTTVQKTAQDTADTVSEMDKYLSGAQ